LETSVQQQHKTRDSEKTIELRMLIVMATVLFVVCKNSMSLDTQHEVTLIRRHGPWSNSTTDVELLVRSWCIHVWFCSMYRFI